jgi:hypothetical protein
LELEEVAKLILYNMINLSICICLIGRIAREVVGKVYELHCYDVSENMLLLTRRTLDGLRDNSVAPLSPVQYHLVNESCSLGGEDFEGCFDFIYS